MLEFRSQRVAHGIAHAHQVGRSFTGRLHHHIPDIVHKVGIVTLPSHHSVGSSASIQTISAATGNEGVVACSTPQRIGSSGAIDPIVAVSTKKRIISAPSQQSDGDCVG